MTPKPKPPTHSAGRPCRKQMAEPFDITKLRLDGIQPARMEARNDRVPAAGQHKINRLMW